MAYINEYVPEGEERGWYYDYESGNYHKIGG